jgi:hypothetical protein
MNADYTVLLNLYTAQRAVAPDDAIVSAAKAGSQQDIERCGGQAIEKHPA